MLKGKAQSRVLRHNLLMVTQTRVVKVIATRLHFRGLTIEKLITLYKAWTIRVAVKPSDKPLHMGEIVNLSLMTQMILVCIMTSSSTLSLLFMMRIRGPVYFTSLTSLLPRHLSYICWFTMKNTTLICFTRNFMSIQKYLMISLTRSSIILSSTTNPTILSSQFLSSWPFFELCRLLWQYYFT
jgi:hypothetical protein